MSMGFWEPGALEIKERISVCQIVEVVLVL